jgi:hypothetical protein
MGTDHVNTVGTQLMHVFQSTCLGTRHSRTAARCCTEAGIFLEESINDRLIVASQERRKFAVLVPLTLDSSRKKIPNNELFCGACWIIRAWFPLINFMLADFLMFPYPQMQKFWRLLFNLCGIPPRQGVSNPQETRGGFPVLISSDTNLSNCACICRFSFLLPYTRMDSGLLTLKYSQWVYIQPVFLA